jgi:hypothetical protein
MKRLNKRVDAMPIVETMRRLHSPAVCEFLPAGAGTLGQGCRHGDRQAAAILFQTLSQTITSRGQFHRNGSVALHPG